MRIVIRKGNPVVSKYTKEELNFFTRRSIMTKTYLVYQDEDGCVCVCFAEQIESISGLCKEFRSIKADNSTSAIQQYNKLMHSNEQALFDIYEKKEYRCCVGGNGVVKIYQDDEEYHMCDTVRAAFYAVNEDDARRQYTEYVAQLD